MGRIVTSIQRIADELQIKNTGNLQKAFNSYCEIQNINSENLNLKLSGLPTLKAYRLLQTYSNLQDKQC